MMDDLFINYIKCQSINITDAMILITWSSPPLSWVEPESSPYWDLNI